MSTTCLPSTSPSVSNVGPGPSATYGTVTNVSSMPKIRIGTSATTSVEIRLFTPPTVEVTTVPSTSVTRPAREFTDSVTRIAARRQRGEYG